MTNWCFKQMVDLSEGMRADAPEVVRMPLTPGDSMGYEWRVTCVRDGKPAALEGSVNAYFLRADGNVVVVEGSVEDNVASVRLPAECCAVSGALDAAIRSVQPDGTRVTLARRTFLVGADVTDGALIDPGDVIPTIDDLLSQMDALGELNEEARALTEDYAASVGALMADAFGLIDDPTELNWESGSFAAADGTPQDNAAYVRTPDFIPVKRGSTVTVKDLNRYRFQCMWYAEENAESFSRDNSKAAGTLSAYAVPADGYLRLSIRDMEQSALEDASVASRLIVRLIGGASVRALRDEMRENRDSLLEHRCEGLDRLDAGALNWSEDTGLNQLGELVTRKNRVSVDGFIACAAGSFIRVQDRRYLLNVCEYAEPIKTSRTRYRGYSAEDWIAAESCFVCVSVRRADGLPLTVAQATAALDFHVFGGGEGDPLLEAGTIASGTGLDIEGSASRMRTVGGVYLRAGVTVSTGDSFPFFARLYDDENCTVFTGKGSEEALHTYTTPRAGWYRFVVTCPKVYHLSFTSAFSVSGANGLSDRVRALEGVISPLDVFPVAHLPAAPWRYTGEAMDMSLLPTSCPDRLETVYRWFEELRARFPDFMTVETIGMDASGEHEIRLYTIEAYPSDERQSVLVASNIHGHERYCLTHTYYLAKTLLERRETDETMAFLWAHARVMIIPAVNPWGVANRRRYNYNHVDLNRNFGASWSAGTDTDGAETWSSGASAGSEPETKAIVKWLGGHPELLFLINRHDSGYYQDNGSVTPAYVVDAMRVDRRVLSPMTRRLENEWRRDHAWLKDVHRNNATRRLFRCNPTSGNLGTMDKWANAKGVHACLLESAVSDVTAGADMAQDTLRMGLEATVETLTHVVAFASLLRSSRDIEPDYVLTEEANDELQ